MSDNLNSHHHIKPLIFGAHGLAGSILYSFFKNQFTDLVGCDYKGRNGLLVCNPNSPIQDQVPDIRSYTHAIICSGLKDYSFIQSNKDYSFSVNVTETTQIIQSCLSNHLKIIYFSSDVVYDNAPHFPANELSVTSAVNEYASQKLQMEANIHSLCNSSAIILRVSRLLGIVKHDGTLLDTIASQLLKNQPVQAADDQIFNPILVDDLSNIICTLIRKNQTGTFNVGSATPFSRYEIACQIAHRLGALNLVERISLADIETFFKRPSILSMDTSKLHQTLDASLTPLSDCISQVITNYS